MKEYSTELKSLYELKTEADEALKNARAEYKKREILANMINSGIMELLRTEGFLE